MISGEGRNSGGPIYMSSVHCPNPETERFLQNCSFTYSNRTSIHTSCTHDQDVSIVCGSFFGPVLSFVAVMKRIDYTTAEAFAEHVAAGLNVSSSRVVVDQTTFYNAWVYVNFTFHEETGTTHPGSEAPSLPASILSMILNSATAGDLLDHFKFYELRSNSTLLQADVVPDTAQWHYRLATSNGTTKNYGRFEVQPGSGAMWGTLCSGGTIGKTEALAACAAIDKTVRHVLGIPYFLERGSGIIYLSNLHCVDYQYGQPLTDTSTCEYTLSTKYKKHNTCSMVTDTGLICGFGANTQTEAPITFSAEIVPNAVQQLADTLHGSDVRRRGTASRSPGTY